MLKLKNGVEIPLIGFGTSTTTNNDVLKNEENLKETIKFGLNIGYRHIDTAKFYKNEDIVGKAIKVTNQLEQTQISINFFFNILH
jgi:diketogulonate reductase-like aldo/keto reductase